MISAVPQIAENNLSCLLGIIHHLCPNYQRWHTACYCRTIKEHVFGSFILLIAHLKDADSVKMLPQLQPFTMQRYPSSTSL
ncbi:hypothetical protein J6590_011963 [Homalodisca vitripennis]|nr:hypothetical protein J6590_011963 [Homalodisca vitripennis]